MTDLLRWLDAAVCSQQPGHSFAVAGRELPLCARDMGLFGGFLLAALVLNVLGRRPPFNPWWLLGLLPLVVDGTNSVIAQAAGTGLYPASNFLRLVTGLACGVAAAALAAPRMKGWYVPVALVLGLVAAGFGGVSFLLAIIGTAGVVTMLVAANQLASSLFWLKLGQPKSAVLWCAALVELIALAVVKHAALAVILAW